MDFKVERETLRFFFRNPKNEQKPSSLSVSLVGATISLPDLSAVCQSMCRSGQGKSLSSQKRIVLDFVRPLIEFLVHSKRSWPKQWADWQLFVVEFQFFILLDRRHSARSTSTRVNQWTSNCRTAMEFLRAEEMLPRGIVIPQIRAKRERTAAKDQLLLGKPTSRPMLGESQPDKTAGSDFAKTDGDFLDSIESGYRARIDLLKSVCTQHWEAMKCDHILGEKLAARVPVDLIKSHIRNQVFVLRGLVGRPRPLASGASVDGLEWGLALGKLFLEEGNDTHCVSTASLTASPFFMGDDTHFRTYSERLTSLTAMPKDAFTKLRAPWQYFRFLGLLSPLDVTAACVLLQIEHPNFNPDALFNAKLLNCRGKHYLATTDTGKQIFSVDKPRAGTRKYVVLTPLAKEIVEYVIDHTEAIRRIMQRNRDGAWRYLFLGYRGSSGIGPMSLAPTEYLTSTRHFSLVRLYPELERLGLRRGGLDFARIRNVMGVLRWFETGSIVEMARTLGNTYKVVLEHYIPPALLHAWNVRLIRRFQQTLVLLAAHEEDFLLDISDFTRIQDLVGFIGQLVLDFPKGKSPLGDQVHARLLRFTSPPDTNTSEADSSGLLHVRLSPRSLGLLYAFADWASGLSDDAQSKSDPQSGLSALKLVDLSRMLRHAAENEFVSETLRDIADVQALRHCHEAALAAQATYHGRFSGFSVGRQWSH